MVHTVSGYAARVYHLISSLYPNEANHPVYGQLHIHDSAEITTKRLAN
jgi:hypothetical protein